ncbi:MAG: undecaprenyldiphospho-muramoylpentapeptide beta-N-acetylglucosaminyltransferase [Myxococcales bacterium]|nr:undecaprenyldiphospho-muramoylpentapeptide beta-N-acetylglucosaminyltransferase [Myxococcales bacterium]
MSTPPHIVIAGGGTGGHLFPGVALADELAARGFAITFVGTARGIEARVIPTTPYALQLIDVAGLKRQGVLATLRSLFRVPLALLSALRILRRIRPVAVVGVGGYASGPLVLCAALSGIPSIVLEQNSIPGLTNKILGRFVRSVVTAFPQAGAFFPSQKVVELGNPIRAAIAKKAAALQTSQDAAAQIAAPVRPLSLLVLGGSQGATAVNDLVVAAVEALGAEACRTLLRIRHQTGEKDQDRIAARYQALGLSSEEASATAFISDMGGAYANCELMVGRAGATTIAELTAIGRPALLIPFLQAADDHQTHNARFMADSGAAELLPQASTTAAQLAERLRVLAHDRDAVLAMAQKSKSLGRPDAAQRIADHLLRIAGQSPPQTP